MGYEKLTAETLSKYICKTQALRSLVGSESFQIKEVGDGNLNFVFVVEGNQTGLIVKQSVPYLRCVGESWKLSKNRMLFEIAALKKFSSLVPQHVPTIYHADREMCLVAMRYLNDHIILRKGLIASKYYPHFAEHISTFLAHTLFKTSSYALSSQEKRDMEGEFNTNHDLCKLSEDLLFTFPYMPHESNPPNPGLEALGQEMEADVAFKSKVLSLKYRFMTQKDALLHGDFHTGSIMVNPQETYVIDPEFAFFGPFGFDVGALVANLLLAHIAHEVCDREKSYSDWLLLTLREFLEKFQSKFIDLLRTQKESALIYPGYFGQEELEAYYRTVVVNILRESIGYAGCKMTRRILGLAGVADIRGIEDPQKRLTAEKKALRLAIDLVKCSDGIDSCDDLFARVTDDR